MFDAVGVQKMVTVLIYFLPVPSPLLSRHPCESRGPVCVHRARLATPLDSCLRRNDGEYCPSSVSHLSSLHPCESRKKK
jgi:hypothetical protein